MHAIGAEDPVDPVYRPRMRRDIEDNGRQDIVCSLLGEPRDYVVEVFRQIAGLPRQVRERGAEMNGMLTGSAGDLKDATNILERTAQNVRDRQLIVFRCL